MLPTRADDLLVGGKRHFLATLFDGCQEVKLDLR
jgi:hypothetical protein